MLDEGKEYQKACAESCIIVSASRWKALEVDIKAWPFDAYYGLFDLEFWLKNNVFSRSNGSP